ncbi:peptidoglycan recognition protein family protein [Agathobaculum sp.]|uniref:peptidoglycan recognition protein family protein n=1 Tax=Agathobaculum sp. TaxID=2048138 RepID=UPI002A833448|nr:N-acetylmuramoyl-L-alanine amidase [Agathobaculum sp.]MDY3618267.1 N-acetylmuramoyl-L-alanine amidase [Agathobaculum sp.]
MRILGFYSGTRGKGKKPNYRPVILLLIVALAFAAGMLVRGWMTPDIRQDANIDYIGSVPVYEDYIAEGSKARPGIQREIKYLVIHETDNFSAGADAKAHNSYIHQAETEESWHYTVDDKQIYHHLPDNEAGYHAGDGMKKNTGNMNGIGIEMCVNEDGNYEQTLINAQKLCARLLVEYDLKPKALRKHEDFSGKVCPAKLIADGRWDEFCAGVESQYKELKAAQKS